MENTKLEFPTYLRQNNWMIYCSSNEENNENIQCNMFKNFNIYNNKKDFYFEFELYASIEDLPLPTNFKNVSCFKIVFLDSKANPAREIKFRVEFKKLRLSGDYSVGEVLKYKALYKIKEFLS